MESLKIFDLFGYSEDSPEIKRLFKELNIPATFLFSLGPDNPGRAIKRIFRPGFLKKVSRTSVVSVYGRKSTKREIKRAARRERRESPSELLQADLAGRGGKLLADSIYAVAP